MTSGEFTQYSLSSIIIDRPSRQRKDFTTEDLEDSIRRLGLIHPPVIQRDGLLIAGERRVTACRNIGWTTIPVQFADELDPLALHAIELEENVKRKDLTWQETCAAVDAYHKLKVKMSGKNWTMTNTAESIGMSPTFVMSNVRVAEELASGNEMVKTAPKFSVARGIVERKDAREKASFLRKVEAPVQKEALTVVPEPKSIEPAIPLLHADFTQWAPQYNGNKFNLIHCDFPYGIKADEHPLGAGSSMDTYNDSFETYENLLDVLGESMENVVAESAHLIFWFAMDHYEYTKDRLEGMGWTLNKRPLIWLKSDNTGILPDPKRGPRWIYETAFFASRGDRLIVRAKANAYAGPATKVVHMSEKPKPMLEHFLGMLVDEFTVMLDPTCGSGGAVKVAKELGASEVLGLEQNEEFHRLACLHWKGETK